jgi:hypothetical protein
MKNLYRVEALNCDEEPISPGFIGHSVVRNPLHDWDYSSHMANGELGISGQLPWMCSTGAVHSNVLDFHGFITDFLP